MQDALGAMGAVAVVIPTRNRRDLVLGAARSALAQTYTDLRCIVVDDGSTDGTAEALGAIRDRRLAVVANPGPAGPSGARNAGVAASGDAQWVAFLDSDDLWAPTKLERQLEALAEHRGAGWATTGCVRVGPDLSLRAAGRMGGPAGPGPERRGGPGAVGPGAVLFGCAELARLLQEENHIPAGSSTVLVARRVLDEAGSFCAELRTNEDWDFWARLANHAPLVYVDSPLVACRQWDGQASLDGHAFVASAALVRARNFPDLGALPRGYAARWEREIGRRHVSQHRRWPAARSYLRAALLARQPGQLAYAVAAAMAPSVAESRLRQVEGSRDAPRTWQAEA
ncbi:MAG: glycosyltransferase family 2 protein, partial [Acidimicrobiales bacterium]